MASHVSMPQLGESVVEGKVSKWLKNEGDPVQQYEALLEVETDKVTTEVSAQESGTLLQILVPEGQTVRAGTILAVIGQPGEAVPAGAAPAVASAHGNGRHEPEPAAPSSASAPAGKSRELGFISPVVASLAAEHQVDLNQVKGTGANGRITKKDVLAYVEQRAKAAPAAADKKQPELAPWEQPGLGELFRPTEELPGLQKAAQPSAPAAPAQPPPAAPPAPSGVEVSGELVPMTSMRRSIAEHMVRSKHTSPHVTTVFEVDFGRVIAHLEANKAAFEREGIRLTFTPYIVQAVVEALRAYPLVNSSWTDNGIELKKQINIGIATAIPEGLIVPVVKNAGDYSLRGLGRAVNDLAERARNKALKPDEVQGATFTITNHGVSGSLFATPIINQPQCAILGVGKIEKRVMVVTVDGMDTIAIRPMGYLSLTFDHRILDGATADHFLAKVKEVLENWA